MKKLFILLLFLSQNLVAQQEAHYTQFMYNKLLLNPAYAGAREVPSVTAIHRSQWVGFDGAPSSQLVSFSSKFFLDRVGIGATVSHVKMGFERDFYGSLAYSYDIIGHDGISVRAGLQGSIRKFGLDFGDPNELHLPVAPSSDETLMDGNISKLVGNFGAGVYGSYKDVVYAGFSVPSLVSNELNSVNSTADPKLLAKVRKHFYTMLGASLPVAEDIRIVPQVLVKYVNNAPLDADLNATLELKKQFGVGLSYRLGGEGRGESTDLLAFVRLKNQFTLGASYDFTLTQVKDYSSGSFEVMLMADLKKTKNEMSNPRFFF